MRTYCVSGEATLATEAQFPSTVADWVEREKTAKHLPVIKAHNRHDRFFAFAVSEYGSLGPQARELLDMVFIRSACRGPRRPTGCNTSRWSLRTPSTTCSIGVPNGDRRRGG